jgi:predicted DNA-binding protein
MQDYICIYLGSKNSKKLREYAKSNKVSISKLVREALEKYFSEMEG